MPYVSGAQGFKFAKLEDVLLQFTATSVTSIAGWSLAFYLKNVDKAQTDSVELTKTTGSGITIIDSVNGILNVTILSADTANLLVGAYMWELWRTDSGAKQRIAYGILQLSSTVTSPT